MNLQTSQYLLPPFISYIETAQPLALPLYLLRLLQNLNYSGHLPLSYFRLHYSICLHLLSCPHPHLETITFLLRGNHLKAIASTWDEVIVRLCVKPLHKRTYILCTNLLCITFYTSWSSKCVEHAYCSDKQQQQHQDKWKWTMAMRVVLRPLMSQNTSIRGWKDWRGLLVLCVTIGCAFDRSETNKRTWRM